MQPCVIPENFIATGKCLDGRFKTRNLIEALVLGIPTAFGAFNLLKKLPIELNTRISITVLLAGSIFVLGIMGICDKSLSEFVIDCFKFNKLKRIAKYNPRIKTEADAEYLVKNDNKLIVDKLTDLTKNIIQKLGIDTEEEISRDIFSPEYIEFFEDDLGIVDTPYDLKTKAQKKKEKKDEKKRQKLKKKEKQKIIKERGDSLYE